MQQVKKIKHLVELSIGRKLIHNHNCEDFIQVDAPVAADILSLIRYYINNQHLVTPKLITSLVQEQLSKYNLAVNPEIGVLPKSNNWLAYIEKLEKLLHVVRYRRTHNFAFDKIMSTQQQLYALQLECLELTEQWYGPGNGNIACFYRYFIAMSQEAYVTSFKYDQIDKYISKDGYISQINLAQRRAFCMQHEEVFFHDFVRQGGRWLRGRSEIDATSMSNMFYYKTAQLLLNYHFAQHLIVTELGLEDYGQLPYKQRLTLWHLLQHNFSDNTVLDKNNIFYKFIEYLNMRPGEFFNYFSEKLPEISLVSQQMLFDIMKIVGIQSRYLILFSRNIVDNWPPKRYLTLKWYRNNQELELARIWPNEMPYAPGHGLSLCGNGLIDDWDLYGTPAYEWNTPVSTMAEKDNYVRDIEKIFKELNLLCPKIKYNNLLPKEQLLSIFQNTISYSTIKVTEHTHIVSCTIDDYPLYLLQSNAEITIPEFKARFQLVQVGSQPDAFFLKILLKELDNNALLNFLITMNKNFIEYFGGLDKVDCHMQLFATKLGDFVFVYEPHARLIQLDGDKFLNVDNDTITPRRPQLLYPTIGNISSVTNEMAAGLDFLSSFFDKTCKYGAHTWIWNYINQYVTTHQ